jgi:hypothetical protein
MVFVVIGSDGWSISARCRASPEDDVSASDGCFFFMATAAARISRGEYVG